MAMVSPNERISISDMIHHLAGLGLQWQVRSAEACQKRYVFTGNGQQIVTLQRVLHRAGYAHWHLLEQLLHKWRLVGAGGVATSLPLSARATALQCRYCTYRPSCRAALIADCSCHCQLPMSKVMPTGSCSASIRAKKRVKGSMRPPWSVWSFSTSRRTEGNSNVANALTSLVSPKCPRETFSHFAPQVAARCSVAASSGLGRGWPGSHSSKGEEYTHSRPCT